MQQWLLRRWLHMRISHGAEFDVRVQHEFLRRRAGAELCALQGVQSRRHPLQPLHCRQHERHSALRVQHRVLRQRIQLQALQRIMSRPELPRCC